MVFGWTYFLILQGIVLFVYSEKRNDKLHFALSSIFSTKLHFVVFNCALFTLCYLFNSDRQLFCNPVPWASTLIILFFIAFLLLPFAEKAKKFSIPISVFSGLGLFITIYAVFFARWEYLIFLVFNIPIILIFHFTIRFLNRKFHTKLYNAFYFYPAAVLTPFLILYELWLFGKSLNAFQRKCFLTTPIGALLVMSALAWRMNSLVKEIRLDENNISKIEKLADNSIDGYLLELILGAHWKFHTELCLLDGWRPPFHDPTLVFSNKVNNPFTKFDQGTSLPNARRLYIAIFPNNPTEFECRCANHERLLSD